jgi:hypothetical protein
LRESEQENNNKIILKNTYIEKVKQRALNGGEDK